MERKTDHRITMSQPGVKEFRASYSIWKTESPETAKTKNESSSD